MAPDNKLELVVTVEVDKANQSIKTVNASLSSMEAAAAKSAKGAAQGLDGMTAAMVKGATAGNLFADAIKKALSWAKEWTIGAVEMAAHEAKLEASMKALAKAHGISAGAAGAAADAVRKVGFYGEEAIHTVNRLIIADMDLSNATGLAKLAKDAAAIENIPAGEAMEKLLLAIEGGVSRGLRSMGIFLDFEKEVQREQLKLGRALNESEIEQVRYNAVMREGAKIQGAHAAASGEAEAQIKKFKRQIHEVREAIGMRFQESYKNLVGHLKDLAKWLYENVDMLVKFGQTALWVSGILASYALASKIMALAKSIAALNLASLNPYTLLAAGVITAGAIVYSNWKNTQEELQGRYDEMEKQSQRQDLFRSKFNVEDLRKKGMTDEQIRELVTGKRGIAGESFNFGGQRLAIQTGNEPDMEALKRGAEIRKRQAEAERESLQALLEARRRSLTGFARDMAEVQEQVRKWTTFVDDKGNEQKIALTRQAWENVIGQLRERLKTWQQEVQETTNKNLTEHLAAEEEAFRRRMQLEAQAYAQRLTYNEEIAKRNLDHLGQMLGIEEQRSGLTRDAELRAVEAVNAQTLEQKVAVEQRKAEIEVAHITRVHEIRMRLFDLETSRMLLEEEANLKRLGYRTDEIQARIAEVAVQRDEIRRTQQEAAGAAIEGARENAAIRQAQLVRDHNRQIFDTFKRQAEGVFDALLTKSQSIWSAIGNSFKTALLTAIKDVVTSRVAALLTQLFTGSKVAFQQGGMGGGMLGGLGGIFGVGAAPVFGRRPIPGGSMGGWGTPPFIPTSEGAGGLGGLGTPPFAPSSGSRWGGLLSGWKDFFGFGGGVQYAPSKAVTWEAATMGQKLSALGRSNAALMGGSTLALMGLQRGGLSGLGMTTAGGALIGFKYGGPVGAAIGAAAGAVAGIVRLFVKGAQEKAREKIKATYGIDISDKTFLKQIVDTAKQSFGGSIDRAIRSPEIRDQIMEYAIATGQNATILDNKPRGVWLTQQGGTLYQSGFYSGNQAFGYASSLPSLGNLKTVQPQQQQAPTIQLNVEETRAFWQQVVEEGIVSAPRAVQAAATNAMRQSLGRTAASINLTDPLATTI